MSLETGQLAAAAEDAQVSAHGELPVIVSIDVGDETWVFPVALATKRGHSFRIYPDTSAVEVIALDGTAKTMAVADAAAAFNA